MRIVLKPATGQIYAGAANIDKTVVNTRVVTNHSESIYTNESELAMGVVND